MHSDIDKVNRQKKLAAKRAAIAVIVLAITASLVGCGSPSTTNSSQAVSEQELVDQWEPAEEPYDSEKIVWADNGTGVVTNKMYVVFKDSVSAADREQFCKDHNVLKMTDSAVPGEYVLEFDNYGLEFIEHMENQLTEDDRVDDFFYATVYDASLDSSDID